ncbi:hypothetical protein [Nocardia donostiensis]|uniref:hypothetical protein n=1 Tax=Nocardia donostiensis TaxID=1538463 RepID=UPI00111564B1|nr:hypothetical protein [Nocardia donostiensis]
MRRVFFALSVLGAGLLTIPGTAGAQIPFFDGTLEVQATNGPDEFPVQGLAVGVTKCSPGLVLSNLTTGSDGTAGANLPADCYRAQVTTVPTGCQLDGPAYIDVDVRPQQTATAQFRLRCA